MKNLHIIATDKPSRLFKVSDELKLTRKFDFYNGAIYQNIYITNDEEIKEGDWIYYTLASGYCKTTVSSKGLEQEGIPAKKIILTTDQDLIKDGVQAIDDEFLEWFVKNPSCEEIEVESNKCLVKRGQCSCSYQDIDCQCLGYKIIIPKEEPIHLLSCCKSLEECYCGKYPKQETLEEAALTLFPGDWSLTERELFKQGAEWQQEQDKDKFSDKEVLQMLFKFTNQFDLQKNIEITAEMQKEWFEQFKKK